MCLKSIVLFITNWVDVLTSIIQTRMMSSLEKDLEIAALRSQLAMCQQRILTQKIKKPLPTPAFRQLWVLLSKYFHDWKSCLIFVRPETVIGWQRQAFRWYW
jgi:putative transposase